MSAQEENEIKEAYSLFAEPMDGEKNGVLPIDDVKSALMYVCTQRTTMETRIRWRTANVKARRRDI